MVNTPTNTSMVYAQQFFQSFMLNPSQLGVFFNNFIENRSLLSGGVAHAGSIKYHNPAKQWPVPS